MTALDQAFIKAFSRQDTFPLAVSPPVAAPENRGERGTRNEERGLGTSVPSGVGNSAGSGFRVQASDAAESKVGKSQIPNPKSPNLQSPIPNPHAQSLCSGRRMGRAGKAAEGGGQPAKERRENAERRNEERTATITQHEGTVRGRKAEGGRRSAECRGRSIFRLECLTAFSVEPSSNPQSPIPNPFLPPSPFPVPPSLAAPVPAEREFKPAWEVDHFTWPRLCRRLIARAAEELDRLADALLAANSQGRKVLAMAGCRRGEGATTLLLCAARRLAERGIKPVLVDADLGRPRLAKRLGVQPRDRLG